jgi:hypothetical protein
MRKRGYTPKPFRQGGLDGLCGIYAIVNALRLVVGNDPRISRKEYGTLFELLVVRAQALRPDSNPSVDGIDTPQLNQLINDTVDYCEEEFDIEIKVSRPLLGGPRPMTWQAIDRLRGELDQPATALIIGFGGLDHWTAIKAITDQTFILHDSSGRKHLAVRRCRMSHSGSIQKRPLLIFRGAAFAVRNNSASAPQ